ncbi:hypothetical protein EMIHUDRAFT_227012 [Emiliania huxleyi CCMP1516]|uniref:Uncharacterized protein n=2 Tax=Emiliania huxleyi TaxID=2903 RepID=A0A0D3KJI3_EMIH1|nr:hypothetical protein EMIHUDRAFT_227012 [Emiliania huxleyi CCMP1516]EOD35918.1 hypothetical protein EMIHUDRAFT_227012 [Emiliania huxleyi CCMP1516]|eukprot:XP_005788347.1 hypothetical protein EMIHUDRAFT_227012 [Emiliania huxleyi CCMP1516]
MRYTEHNLTLAPSQPPPLPPPLPPEVKAVLSMCVVATRRYLPDADSLRQLLIGPEWSLYGFVRPQLLVSSADGCDLPNFDSINQSKKICSKPDSLTDTCESGALLRILPKTSKATSQVVVGTSGSSSLVGSEGGAGRTAVYSVTVLDFVDLAKGSQSWLSRFCGNFVSVVCSNVAAADQIQCGNFARAICYPSEGLAGGYLDISVFNAVSDETSMAALRVLDPEWSVDSPPWSSIDVIWMLLWLLPAWLDGILKDNLPEDMHDSLPAEQCGTYDMLEDPFSAPKDYVFRLDGCNAVILPKFALRDDGAVALSQAIKGNPSLRLEALNLFYTGMAEAGVEAIAKAIGSGTQHALLTLLLGDNQVGDGVFALATAVKRLPSLIVLDLSRANIGDAAMWEGGATSALADVLVFGASGGAVETALRVPGVAPELTKLNLRGSQVGGALLVEIEAEIELRKRAAEEVAKDSKLARVNARKAKREKSKRAKKDEL